jgi:hypothetical protein
MGTRESLGGGFFQKKKVGRIASYCVVVLLMVRIRRYLNVAESGLYLCACVGACKYHVVVLGVSCDQPDVFKGPEMADLKANLCCVPRVVPRSCSAVLKRRLLGEEFNAKNPQATSKFPRPLANLKFELFLFIIYASDHPPISPSSLIEGQAPIEPTLDLPISSHWD